MQPNYLTNASIEAAISESDNSAPQKPKRRYIIAIIGLIGLLIGATSLHANMAGAAEPGQAANKTDSAANSLEAYENLRSLVSADFRQILIDLNLEPTLTGNGTQHEDLGAVSVELTEGTTAWVFFIDIAEVAIVERDAASGYVVILQNSDDLSALFAVAPINFLYAITESTPAVEIAGIHLGEWVQGVGFSTPYDVLELRG